MDKKDMTFSFTVDRTPEQVFDAINDVRAWWTGEITGETDKLGAEFTFRYKDMHRSTQKVVEWAPGRRVVWRVTDSHLSFLKHKSEWTGTEVVFDITRKGGKTALTFTHVGLTPEVECFDACTEGWGYFVNESLLPYILTGRPQAAA